MTTPDRPGALSERLAALVGQAAPPARPVEEAGPSELQLELRDLSASVAAVRGQLDTLAGDVESSVERAVGRAVPPPAELPELPEPPDLLGALEGRADALEDRLSTASSTLGVTLEETQRAVDALGESVRGLQGELGAMEARLGARVDDAALALAEAIVGLVAGVLPIGAPAQEYVEPAPAQTPVEVGPSVEQPEVVEAELIEQPEVEQPEVEQPEVEQPEVEQPEVEQPEVEQPETAAVPELVVPDGASAPWQPAEAASAAKPRGFFGRR